VVNKIVEGSFLPSPEQNYILGALKKDARERIFPHLEEVQFHLGEVLYEPGDTPRYVYFPTDSIVSLLYVMEDGRSAEISVVGKDGLVGIALFMGGESTPSRALVQSAGSAFRLPSRRLKDEFGHKLPSVIDIIQSISNCVGGCFYPLIGCRITD
jgi:CRP-like cAMP-binding protein